LVNKRLHFASAC